MIQARRPLKERSDAARIQVINPPAQASSGSLNKRKQTVEGRSIIPDIY
jgi:hypothetical protein